MILFAAGDAVARGEISPDYMYSREALMNIARDLPRACSRSFAT